MIRKRFPPADRLRAGIPGSSNNTLERTGQALAISIQKQASIRTAGRFSFVVTIVQRRAYGRLVF